MSIHNFLQRFFFLLIFVWLLLSVAREIYNLSKIVGEDIPALKLSDTQKKEEIFGQYYHAFKFVENRTAPDAEILFIVTKSAKESGVFYQALFFLYPRGVSVLSFEEAGRIVNSKNKFKYIFVLLNKDDKSNTMISEPLSDGPRKNYFNFSASNLKGTLVSYE